MPEPVRRKLIEVALPLEAINRESAREKSIRHGHPSTLHLWWARRPLAACRAVLFAQLVDDLSARPEEFPTQEAQDRSDSRGPSCRLGTWPADSAWSPAAAPSTTPARCFWWTVRARWSTTPIERPAPVSSPRTSASRVLACTFRLRGEVIATLGPALAYRHRAGDDTDRKIIEVVRETGQVTGRLVRNILDVHASTASKLLADLVDRRILVKTSEAQRGPSVTYGRGPQFPATRPRKRAAKNQEPSDASAGPPQAETRLG